MSISSLWTSLVRLLGCVLVDEDASELDPLLTYASGDSPPPLLSLPKIV